MKPLPRESIATKTATELKVLLADGGLRGKLPGVRRLAEKLQVSRDNIRLALQQLEAEGWLRPVEQGRAREVVSTRPKPARDRSLHVAILTFESPQVLEMTSQNEVLSLKLQFENNGHHVVLATEAGTPTAVRLEKLVKRVAADAWILYRAEQPVMRWFIDRRLLAYAMGGMTVGLNLAASSIFLAGAIEQAVDQLVSLGHRRIVLITSRFLRHPLPSSSVARFIEVMDRHGIRVDGYHLPEWPETPAGLQLILGALFQTTPPTALLVMESAHALGALSFFQERKIAFPQQLSFVAMLADPMFGWWQPGLAHFRWSDEPQDLHLQEWLKNVAKGKPTTTQHHEPATFHAGTSIGPVPRRG